MRDIWTETVAILVASLVICAFASAIILFRPAARRRRRHKRHTRQPRIDLLKHEPAESAAPTDA